MKTVSVFRNSETVVPANGCFHWRPTAGECEVQTKQREVQTESSKWISNFTTCSHTTSWGHLEMCNCLQIKMQKHNSQSKQKQVYLAAAKALDVVLKMKNASVVFVNG